MHSRFFVQRDGSPARRNGNLGTERTVPSLPRRTTSPQKAQANDEAAPEGFNVGILASTPMHREHVVAMGFVFAALLAEPRQLRPPRAPLSALALRNYAHERFPQSVGPIAILFTQNIGQAMDWLHQQELVHLSLGPESAFLGTDGQFRLMCPDLPSPCAEVAAFLSPEAAVRFGRPCGVAGYAPIDQRLCRSMATPAIYLDRFAFASSAFSMWLGRALWGKALPPAPAGLPCGGEDREMSPEDLEWLAHIEVDAGREQAAGLLKQAWMLADVPANAAQEGLTLLENYGRDPWPHLARECGALFAPLLQLLHENAWERGPFMSVQRCADRASWTLDAARLMPLFRHVRARLPMPVPKRPTRSEHGSPPISRNRPS